MQFIFTVNYSTMLRQIILLGNFVSHVAPYTHTSLSCSLIGTESLRQDDIQSYCSCGYLSPGSSENHTLFFYHTPPWVILHWFRTFCCRKLTWVLADSFLPVCVYSLSLIICLQLLLSYVLKNKLLLLSHLSGGFGVFLLSIFITLESCYMLFASICPCMK